MNDKRKEYLKKWREDNKEHISNYKKEYAKTHDSSFKKLQDKYKQLQEENKQIKEVIDKAIDLIEKSGTTDIGIDSNNNIIHYHQLTEDETDELLDILKEVKTC